MNELAQMEIWASCLLWATFPPYFWPSVVTYEQTKKFPSWSHQKTTQINKPKPP